MAYLTVRLSAGSYDPATNSTPVSATVSITWDTSESYNQEHGTGTLTIGNNYSTTFSTDFNASRTESGTQVLGGGSTTIKHDSNGSSIQVVASASGAGRSASDMVTLPGGTPSSDSGGSGNEDSGNGSESGGNSSNDNPPTDDLQTCVINIEQGEYTTVRVIVIDGGETLNDGEILNNGYIIEYIGNGPTLQIFYRVDDGYIIDEHTINGETFESGYEWKCNSSVCTIKTSAVESENPSNTSGICIDNGSGFEEYDCYIDNGTSWDKYIPYITVENHYSWDGLFKATVNSTNGLNLRESADANSTVLTTIPYNTELTIEDITINSDDTGVWAKTTYSSYTGWCSAKYLTYIIYAQVINPNGARLCDFGTESLIESSDVFPYNSELKVAISDYSNDALVVYNDEIWGHTVFVGLHDDGSPYNMYGYIKMSDVEIVSERTVLEWVPLTLEVDMESVRYLYKDGVMYSPLLDGLTKTYCTISNANNMLVYKITQDGEEGSSALTEKSIDLSNFKYLCVKTGNIGEVDSDTSLAYHSHLYIGINNSTSTDIALNYAMCLTEDDSNKILYVDLSSIDLFYKYYFGFGTECNYGSFNNVKSYIEEIWFSNNINTDMILKSFDYTLSKRQISYG